MKVGSLVEGLDLADVLEVRDGSLGLRRAGFLAGIWGPILDDVLENAPKGSSK